MSADEAVAAAMNHLEPTAAGYRLRQPHQMTTFTPAGITVTPESGRPAWTWQLVTVTTGDQPLTEIEESAVRPVKKQPLAVVYPRGDLVEQYLVREQTIEQQFLIPQPLPLAGADLTIVGTVQSTGAFQAAADGWCWETADEAVCLGDVQVYDAAGQTVPAQMTVTANATRIEVDGVALARAAYPVTIDPEIGTNDFRLSRTGGDTQFDALNPAVAYNSTDNEYLVVWHGDDYTGTLVENEFEIFGQRVDGGTGDRIGATFRLSDMGPDGSTAYFALDPAVAYNSTDNEYLVVWEGDDNIGPLVDDEFEIFGQRVSAAGSEAGPNDFRISDMGPNGDVTYAAGEPAVAYNSTDNEYLVVWEGDDDSGSLVDEEFEIFGQLVSAAGGELVPNDFRLSDMGSDGNPSYDAFDPAVAYNSTDNEFLVVWSGDDTGESEIFGQRASATGTELSPNDFRLSDMGPNGNVAYAASVPAVAYNDLDNEYLVVWEGDDDSGSLVDEEFEIYGQRVDGETGMELSPNDFRLSDMGPDGNTNYEASDPAVAYDRLANEYLVIWHGDDDTGPLVDEEVEIFGQRVRAIGVEVGTNDFRLSDMGPNGDTSYAAFDPAVVYTSLEQEFLVVWWGNEADDAEIFGQQLNDSGTEVGTNDSRLSFMGGDLLFDAFDPAVAYNSTDNEYLVVWSADDNTGSLVDEEFEIFGQRVDGATGNRIGAALRLSDMGPDGNADYDATNPAVAYNSTSNEYLVVWDGDDNTAPLVDEEFEIFSQRLTAGGVEAGNDHRLSDMGPDGNPAYGAFDPAVVYNSIDKEYLVVWSGEDDSGGLADNEFEIFGQRVDAVGTEVGSDFRLSDMGPDGNTDYFAIAPAMAYNSTDNEYLVVWSGDDNTAPLVDNGFEIFGQRVSSTGAEVGSDFRLSNMGPDGSTSYAAFSPAVAYNSTSNEYLVVWEGDDDTGTLVDEEFEIFGQRLTAGGVEAGSDIRLSDMGPDGNTAYSARVPAVVYESTGNAYLVIWFGDDNTGPLVEDEFEIFSQQVSASGTEVAPNDVRLSDMGPDGNAAYAARGSAVAYNSTNDELLAVWEGDDNTGPLVDEEFEIFGQRFTINRKIYLPILLRNHS